jgi:hypothetical protein
MARKITDIVQVKLRIPEWLRREVLLAAKKSGRSLNGELSHLIEEGLAKPEYESLIKGAVETASVAAATRTMVELAALMSGGGSTPGQLSKVLESLRATEPPSPQSDHMGVPHRIQSAAPYHREDSSE